MLNSKNVRIETSKRPPGNETRNIKNSKHVVFFPCPVLHSFLLDTFQAQYDRMKRKALLGTNSFNQEPPELNPPGANLRTGSFGTENAGNRSGAFTTAGGGTGNLNSVIGDMEANKVRYHEYHLLSSAARLITLFRRCNARHSSIG